MDSPKDAPGSIGHITLRGKCAGARSAGKPHAACDVAGAGNRLTVRLVSHSHRKRGETDRPRLRSTAPALDPTAFRLLSALGGPSVLPVLGRVRVVPVGVRAANLPVAAVDHDLRPLLLGDVTSRIDSRPFAFGGARCLACCPRHEPPMLCPVEPRVGLYLLPCVPLVFTSPQSTSRRHPQTIRCEIDNSATSFFKALYAEVTSGGNRIRSALSHRTEPPRSRQRAHHTSADKREGRWPHRVARATWGHSQVLLPCRVDGRRRR